MSSDSAGCSNAVTVSAAVPAATSGANSRFHRGPAAVAVASSVSTSAAAIGVPNSAPTVAAAASTAAVSAGTRRHSRAAIHTVSAVLIAVIGFSGPKLTPPAMPRTSTRARLGSTRSGCGVSSRSRVAGSGPAWPGSFHTSIPATAPVRVRMVKIHHPDRPSTFSRLGVVVHRSLRSCSVVEFSAMSSSAQPIPIATAGKASTASSRGPGACSGAPVPVNVHSGAPVAPGTETAVPWSLRRRRVSRPDPRAADRSWWRPGSPRR